ncbi:MAG: extracellular solute-binding protein [Lachnospiraceae bacterium]|nr:extracellular solute-binding protein [Lachnospiraceae bacterium]
MSLKKRLTAIGILAVMAGLIFVIAGWGTQAGSEEAEIPMFSDQKETIYIWYTDEVLTSYISSVAVTYGEEHDVRVVPVLASGLEYLEAINQASLTDEVPDLFVLTHDSLEKAYLAGLAEEIVPQGEACSPQECFIGTGLQAVTYKDKLIAYPFYFETSSLLYNKTYLEDMAKKQIEAEADLLAAKEAEKELEENGPETESSGNGDEGMPDLPIESENTESAELTEEQKQQIEQKMQELLPATIEDIKAFADDYDAPESVESIFRWDVTDIFYNYFFVGAAMNVGGEAGWDISQIDIYNEKAIKSMRSYESLNQFFSIDTSEIDYEKVIDEFISGKVVFTVATTDVVSKIEQAKEDGLFAYEYGITQTPDIDENMKTRSLSVTNCVVVNGYGQNRELANDFAHYLTVDCSDSLFARTGKVSAMKGVDYGYEALQEFAKEYENSISMPKMIETSNFWVLLESVFADVWDGADANRSIKALSEQIMKQVTGREYEETYIHETEPVEEETENS